MTFTTCLGLLASSFVARSLQIHADMRLARASLADKIPAASCKGHFFTAPYAVVAESKPVPRWGVGRGAGLRGN
jgi:hypothetical protein